MPTFNSAAYLHSAVESVLAQTFGDWELILTDDGSTDTTIEVIGAIMARDPRIRSVTAPHMGPAAARNSGLHESDSRGEFVVFLDSDDTWEPNALAILLRALERAPDCVAAYGLARATDENGRQFEHDDLADSMRRRLYLEAAQYVELPSGSNTTFEAMLLKNSVVTPGTTLVRRSALDAVGDLEPATSPGDDWDLFLRLARVSDFVLVDEIILNWRRHPGSLANTSKKWRQAQLSVLGRAIASRQNTPRQRRAAVDALVVACRESRRRALGDLRHGRILDASRGWAFALDTYRTRAMAEMRRHDAKTTLSVPPRGRGEPV
jgi:glycosyltransferase involved in cell wall biosynthesis